MGKWVKSKKMNESGWFNNGVASRDLQELLLFFTCMCVQSATLWIFLARMGLFANLAITYI